VSMFEFFRSGRSRLVHVDKFGEPLDPQPAPARAPATATVPRRAPERPPAARQPAMTSEAAADVVTAFLAHERAQATRSAFTNVPPDVAGVVAAAIARTPAPAPRPRPSPTTPARPTTDHLLALTPLGRNALRLRERRERDAAARTPAPISAEVRAALGATSLGREVLADRQRADPEGEAQAAGVDPARRRELLEASTLGRAMLADEARRR